MERGAVYPLTREWSRSVVQLYVVSVAFMEFVKKTRRTRKISLVSKHVCMSFHPQSYFGYVLRQNSTTNYFMHTVGIQY